MRNARHILRRCLTAGSLLAGLDVGAATLLSQDFGTDPVNYSLPGGSNPFRFYAGPRYWARSDSVGLVVNAAITGNDGPYLGAQNLNDGGFSFSAAAPAQIDFAVSAIGYTDLTLAIALAGLPAAEATNFIRARTDNDGDGSYETILFDFKGNSNSAYIDATLGALTAAFQSFSGIALAKPVSADGFLRLRLEVFNDTESANEAAGIDSLVVSGTASPRTTAITLPANGARVTPTVAIHATAEGGDGPVTNVCFYADEVLLGSDDARPYGHVWRGAAAHDHVLRTVAWGADGSAATSTPVNVTVSEHPIAHVLVISVDGMGSAYIRPLLTNGIPNELTAFRRFQTEGSGTLNARNDANYAITLPNHVTMVTGRGVSGAAGHNWTTNVDPLPTDTIAANKGSYVASVFDVAHDNGLRTGIWSGKSKFALFQQSYGADSGEADTTGVDNGRDKIDYALVAAGIPAAALTDDLINAMAAAPFNYVFLHYQDPDATGHASGWSTDPASSFATSLKQVDGQIGRVLDLVDGSSELSGCTTVILTADHGGHGTTHGDTTNPLDYTVPFYVWGAGVTAGTDLYDLNPVSRTAPGPTTNPPYTGGQPVRNGDAANLALDLLGLGTIPLSMVNSNRNLQVAVAPHITGVSCSPSASLTIITGDTDVVGVLVTEQTASLSPAPVVWQPVQTNAVAAGTFAVGIPQGTNAQAFFRLLRR